MKTLFDLGALVAILLVCVVSGLLAGYFSAMAVDQAIGFLVITVPFMIAFSKLSVDLSKLIFEYWYNLDLV